MPDKNKPVQGPRLIDNLGENFGRGSSSQISRQTRKDSIPKPKYPKAQPTSNKVGQVLKSPVVPQGESLGDFFASQNPIKVNTSMAITNTIKKIVDESNRVFTDYKPGDSVKFSDRPKKIAGSKVETPEVKNEARMKAKYLKTMKQGGFLGGLDQTANKAVGAFGFFATSLVARVADLPDFIQSVAQLPTKYTVKDVGLSLQYYNNELDAFTKSKVGQLLGSDKLSQKIETDYQKNKKRISLELDANKVREGNSIRNGTLEQETEDWYNSNIVTKGMPEMMKTFRKVGKYFDTDEGMGSSALDYIEKLNATNQAAFEGAYEEQVRGIQTKVFNERAEAEMAKHPGATQEQMQKRIEVIAKATFNDNFKQRGLLKESFDNKDDKRNGLEKLISGEFWNYNGTVESFNANITDNIVQSVAQIAATAFVTRGLGAGLKAGEAVATRTGSLAERGALATKNRIAKGLESEFAGAVKSKIKGTGGLLSESERLAVNKFTDKLVQTTAKAKGVAKQSEAITQAVSTAKKGYSTLTDKINPMKNYFGETTQKLKEAYDKTKANLKPSEKTMNNLQENATFSTILGFDESQQIGIDVYNRAVEDKISGFIGTLEDFTKTYSPENGKEFSKDELKSIEQDYDLAVDKFAENEPELFSHLIEESTKAGRLAASTNFLPEVASNMFVFGKYLKSSKMVTREAQTLVGLAKNNAVTRLGATMFKEGVLQEMGMNYLAEKKGDAYAKGEGYSLVADFVNKDLRSKDAFENLLSGMLMGGGQHAATEVYTGAAKRDFQKYGAYRDVVKDMRELSKYTGKDELKKYITLDLDAQNMEEYNNKEEKALGVIAELKGRYNASKDKKEKSTIKKEIIEVEDGIRNESKKLITTRINNAIHAGTVDKLINTLEIMSQQEGNTPMDVHQLKNTIDIVKSMEEQYVKHEGMKDSGAIISNRFTHENNSKALEDAKSHLSARGTNAVFEALDRQARLQSKEKGVDKNGKRHAGVARKLYKELKTKFREQFNEGTLESDFNETNIRAYQESQNTIDKLQDLVDRGELEYQKLVSEDYQAKFDDSVEFIDAMFKHYNGNTKSEEKKIAQEKDIVKRYSKILSPVEMDALKLQAKTKANNIQAALDALSEIQSKAAAKEEADKAVEANKKINKVKEETKNNPPNKSVEEKVAEQEIVPTGSVPSKPVLTPEERGDISERLTELSEKETLSPEEKVEEKELQVQDQESGIQETFDALLNPSKEPEKVVLETPELSASQEGEIDEADELEAMLALTGAKRNPAFKPGSSTPGLAPSEDAGKGSSNTVLDTENNYDDEDDNTYSKRAVRETEENTNKYKDLVDSVLGTLSFKLNKPESEISHEDLVRYMQEQVGSDNLDLGWDMLAIGYKALRPQDENADFDLLYNKMFKDHSGMFMELLDETTYDKEGTPVVPKPVKEAPRTIITPSQATASTIEEVNPEDLAELAGPERTTESANERVEHSGLNLSLDNLLQAVFPQLNKLNKAFINAQKLLDFKSYEGSKNNKIKLTIRIPENYGEIYIYEVNENKNRPGTNLTKPILFSAWEARNGFAGATEAKKRQSPLWLANVPMIGYDSTGEGVMQVNNGDFASKVDILEYPINISKEDKQALIDHATKANMAVRQSVIENKSTEITTRVDFQNSNKGFKGPEKLVSSEPESSFTEKRVMIGKYNAGQKGFVVDGNLVETNNNDLTPFIEATNKNVVIRQVGLNEDGTPIYQAMRADRMTLTGVHVESAINAMRVYMMRAIPDASFIDHAPGMKAFRDRQNTEGGLNLEQHKDLSAYLSSFIKLSPFNAQTEGVKTDAQIATKFANFINNGSNTAQPGQPSIALVNFKIVIAIKPAKGVLLQPEDIMILDPLDLDPKLVKDSQERINNLKQVEEALGTLKNAMAALPNKVEIRGGNPSKTNKFFLYNEQEGQVEEFSNYDDFKAQHLYMPRPLGSAEVTPGVIENKRADGSSFTTMYGYYNFKIDSPEITSSPQKEKEIAAKKTEEKNIKQDVKETIKAEDESISEQELEEKTTEVVNQIKKATKALEIGLKNQLPASLLAKMRANIETLKGNLVDLGQNLEDFSFSKRPMTEAQMEELQKLNSEMSVNVEGLTLSQQHDIVDSVFHSIASSIGYKKGNSISKAKILEDIKRQVISLIENTIESNTESINSLREMNDSDYNDFIEALEAKNTVYNNVKDNWKYLEGEVLEMLEQKVGIKEVKNTTKAIQDDNLVDEDEDVEATTEFDVEDSIDDSGDVDEREKDYNSSSLEVKGKPSGSAKMKRFLAGIPVIFKDGTTSVGFLDRVRHYDFLDLDNLLKVALNSPTEIDSDLETVYAKLEEIGKEHPWALAILAKLKNTNTSEQARIEFLYNYTGRHSLSSKFVEFVQAKNGSFTTRIIDANFNDVAKNIRETWKNNIKTQGVLYVNDSEGDYVPDMKVVTKLIADFKAIQSMTDDSMGTEFTQGMNFIPNDFRDMLRGLQDGESMTIPADKFVKSKNGFIKSVKGKFPAKVNFKTASKVIVDMDADGNVIITKDKINEGQVEALSNWLADVGLNLNAATMLDLVNNGLDLKRQGKLDFTKLLDDPKSPFVNMMYNLEKIQSRVAENLPVDFESFSVLENFNNRLLPLADLEAKYTDRVITKNFRDNGKLISGLPVGKFATDRIKDLKGSSETESSSIVRSQLRQLSFNKNSILLDLLENDNATFRNILKIHHVAVGSLKKKDSKFGTKSKVTQLTATDLEASKLAHFFETNNVPNYANTGLLGFSGDTDVRVGNYFLPTMSDKDQMMLLQNLIFKVKENDFVEGQLSDRFLELLYTQLVQPDLERISKYHSNGKSTNIKDYDNAAQLFTLIPSLNNLKTKNGINLTTAMKNEPSVFNSDYIKGQYGDLIKEELNAFINSEVENKLKYWTDIKITEKNKIKVNSSYLDTRSEGNKDYKKRNTNIAAEFIINNLVNNANLHMAIIGDPALYSKSKPFSANNFMTNEDGSIDVTRPRDNVDANAIYRDWSESSLGGNLGKRLALILAPGNKIFNSKNETYKQVFLKDFIDISTNIVDIVTTAYGEDVRDQLQLDVDAIKQINEDLSSSEITKSEKEELRDLRDGMIKELEDKYPAIADYLEIESTDAQEYTTVSEHLHVMRAQGRIDDETMFNIKEKLFRQRQDLHLGNPINKENYLTKEELGFVMQPMKPVYTGQVFDPEQDVMRTVYVKSSAFPLLPQLTVGTELDGLRVAMEQYEIEQNKSTNGKNYNTGVRVSYDTAYKVGGNKNAISAFLPNGRFNAEAFTPENVDKAALTLNRNEFRIQQDVPFKSDKGSEDVISYGTQMLKILFSNGILDVDSGFMDPDNPTGDTISGPELFNKFNDTFQDLVNIKKRQLYKELGLDINGKGSNNADFRANVEKLLIKEGQKRNYNKNELDSVRLDKNGNFQLPLYLNSQSSKIESLLLSIVTKRVINHKLPGYSYIAASEAGFKFVDDVKLVPGSNRTIYLDSFEKAGGQLSGIKKSGDGVNLAQILVPSKFRDNQGKLLDLFSTYRDGTYKYLTVGESGRYILKEDMIEPLLMQLPTFRIPSSSHVSLSQVQIVGFLPPESGDMIVVPKNFTKQKGLDFDVDKENTYHLWTYIGEGGKVQELSQKRVDELLVSMEERQNKKLSRAQDSELRSELAAVLGSDEALAELEELKDNYEKMVDSFKDQMAQKLAENKIIKIHSSVLSNPSSKVQQKITKVLSMDFADSQAEKITALKEVGAKNTFANGKAEGTDMDKAYSEKNRHFSILSDAYQTKKMFLGSAGQSGIGVYSNFLTMASLMQQYGQLGDFSLMTKDKENSKVPLQFSIDGVDITASLGRLRTVDGERTISEVFEELQNTATDNEKAQIMGRTGINNHTIGIFSLMSALGIDKTGVSYEVASKYGIQGKKNTKDSIKMSFGNLLLSQDIVKKFTDLLEDKNSATTDVDTRSPEKIIQAMIDTVLTNLDEAGVDVSTLVDNENDFNMLSGDNLVNNIAEVSSDTDMINYQVLSFMKLMMEYQTPVRDLQKVLNMSSKGLGLDLIEANNNLKTLVNVMQDTTISGVRQLLFDDSKGYKDAGEDKNNYVFIKKLGGIKPSSPLGASILNSFQMIDKAWSDFYPYTNDNYFGAMGFVARNADVVGKGAALLNLERLFNKALKKHTFADNRIFTGDIRAERDGLFFDVPGQNESLASYLKRIVQDQPAVTDVIKDLRDNPLIRKFTYDINKNDYKNIKNRRPSTIVYNIANSSQENEAAIERALIELIEKNEMLEPKNGVPYTTRDLAQELILSSYLEGGVQEIRQFIKYIPVTYLEVMGFGEDMNMSYNDITNLLALPKDADNKAMPSDFIRQFFQHNPEVIPELKTIDGVEYSTLKEGNVLNAETMDTFDFSGVESADFQQFLTIRDTGAKGKGKGQLFLFERVGKSTVFNKIETLGFPGLSEYSPGVQVVQGLKNLNDYSKLPKVPTTKVVAKRTDTSINLTDFGIKDGGSIREVVNNMMNSTTEGKDVIALFEGYFTDDIKLKVVPEEDDMGADGMYSRKTNTVTISQKVLDSKSPEHIAMIMAKELVHAATANQVAQYVNKAGEFIIPPKKVPMYVRKLVTMFKELRAEDFNHQLEPDGPTLGQFLDNYKFRSGDTMNQSQADSYYGFTNINEFMEMSLSSSKFRDYMEGIGRNSSKRSFKERLKDILKEVLNIVALQGNKTISQEVVDTVHRIIFEENNIVSGKINTTPSEGDSYSKRRVDVEDLILATERLINNNKPMLETSIKNDPFKC